MNDEIIWVGAALYSLGVVEQYWNDTTFGSKPSSQAGLLCTLGEAQCSLAHAKVLSSPEVTLPPIIKRMGS